MLLVLQANAQTMSLSICGKYKKKTEQKFQNVAQKVKCANNSDTVDVYFAQHFNQKPTPKQ